MKQINIELLRELTDYDPKIGKMTWKERDIKHFKSLRDCNIWNSRFAGKECGWLKDDGHRVMEIIGTKIFVHRAAWAHYYGRFPKLEIDHENHIRDDNRLSNLRETNENDRNRSKTSKNTSGYTGVSWNKEKQKWHARVGAKHIGYFKDVELAGFVAELTRDKLGYHKNHGK